MDNTVIIKRLPSEFRHTYKLILTRPELFKFKMWKLLLNLIIFSLAVLATKVPSKFKTLQCVAVAKEFGEFKVCEIKAKNRNKNIINVSYLLKKKIDDIEV